MNKMFLKITTAVVMLLLTFNFSYAQIVMRGTVSSNKGDILVGALLMVEDTNIGVLSNVEGEYMLTIPEEYTFKDILVSYSGYDIKRVPVEAGVVDVVLTDRPVQKTDEVTVNTQKRLEREVDVPIAITVLQDAKIRQQNFGQIDEMSFFIPGFQNNFQDYSSGVYSIRGVGSDGVESYFQQRISVYQDNISIGRLQTSLIEPMDLARVEVVKGPQGTLFGRGALVGAVQYVRNKPVKYLDFQVMAKYGAYNQRGGEVMVNTPLGKRVANRLAIRHDAHDGYIDNEAGGKANGKNAIAFKNATSFFLNERNLITLTVDMVCNNDPATCFKTNKLGTLSNPKNTSPYTSAYFNGGDSLGLSRKVYNGILQYEGNISEHLSLSNTIGVRYYINNLGYDVDGSYQDILFGLDRAEGYQISEEFRVNWDNGRRLSGFCGVSYVHEYNEHQYFFDANMQRVSSLIMGPKIRQQLADVPDMIGDAVAASLDNLGAAIKAQAPGMESQIDNLVESFKPLAKEGVVYNLNRRYDNLYLSGEPWEKSPDLVAESVDVINTVLTTHMSYLMESNQQVGALLQAVMGEGSVEDFVKSLPFKEQLSQYQMLTAISGLDIGKNHYEDAIDKSTTKELGVFAEMKWNFYKNLYLTLGLRGTNETMETGYQSGSEAAPISNQSLLLISSNGEQLLTKGEYQSWVGRAVINWKFDAMHNVYASVSKGRRPAQIYYDLRPDVVVELRPEHLYNYEIGIKGISQNGYFNYNVANYYYVWHNFQSTEYGAREDGSVGYITNDKGRARGFGLDGSLLYTFSPKLSSFIDWTICYGRFSKTDMDGNDQELAGSRFRLNPEHKFDIGFNITRQLGKREHILHIHPLLALVGKYYFTEPNVDYLRQDAYAMLNLNVGYQWKGAGNIVYDISLYGKNLLNTRYCVDAGNSGDVFGYPTYVAGAPITYGVVLRLGLDKKR